MEIRSSLGLGRTLWRVASRNVAATHQPVTSTRVQDRLLSNTSASGKPEPAARPRKPMFRDFLSDKAASSPTSPSITTATKLTTSPLHINPMADHLQPRTRSSEDDVIENMFIGPLRAGADASAQAYRDAVQKRRADPDDIKLRLRPTTGKTIRVDRSGGPERAMKLLEVLVARNRLKQMSYSQRFHERPGLKRKRLARERYGKRAKASFKASCARVRMLAKQGW